MTAYPILIYTQSFVKIDVKDLKLELKIDSIFTVSGPPDAVPLAHIISINLSEIQYPLKNCWFYR